MASLAYVVPGFWMVKHQLVNGLYYYLKHAYKPAMYVASIKLNEIFR